MATFRSAVKILGQVSKTQGCKPVHIRSYSDDRKTLLHRHNSPGWTSHESRTPLHSSRSWFSLFRRKKSPENKITQQDSCQVKTPEDDSWLSFFKKKVSKEEPPPLTCCRMHQAKLKREEEQRALEEGREPEGWKPDVTIVNEESGNPVICKPPLDPQPTPPPQPPIPRAVEVMKDCVEKSETKSKETCDLVSSKMSYNMRLPYEEFKTPITIKSSPPVSTDNLQPRRQSPFVSGEKFTEGSTFQPCKKFHEQSNLKAIPTPNISNSKHIENKNIALNQRKVTLKPKLNKSLSKKSKSQRKDSNSKVFKNPIVMQANSKESDKLSLKQDQVPNKVSVQYNYSSESNQLLTKSFQPVQRVVKRNDKADNQRLERSNINEIDKIGFQNEIIKINSRPAKLSKTLSVDDKEKQLTIKICSNVSQATKKLQQLTEKRTAKEKRSTQIQEKKMQIKAELVKKLQENLIQLKAKFADVNKQSSKTLESREPTKITSSPSLTNLYEHINKQTKSPVADKEGILIKSSTLPSTNIQKDCIKVVGKVSPVSMKVGSTKKDIKEGWEKIKINNKSVRLQDDSFLSTWKDNYSYIGFSRKAQNKRKSKLSSKGNEKIKSLLPSNIQPFVLPNEGMQAWSRVISKDIISVRKRIKENLKQSPKSSPKYNNEYCKEPWFIECQKNYVDMEDKDSQFINDSTHFRQKQHYF
ncbi:hypothetical protein L9F63_006016 [Diploptera punctata]|uniref:Uncharacterized protein n=1 Tax=Diploptera punctata TaxID=6984 RepID=A0AAD8E4W4_DIPPU|nr:hypothetical protein L9F63_006016 [Diploptera punctata]